MPSLSHPGSRSTLGSQRRLKVMFPAAPASLPLLLPSLVFLMISAVLPGPCGTIWNVSGFAEVLIRCWGFQQQRLFTVSIPPREQSTSRSRRSQAGFRRNTSQRSIVSLGRVFARAACPTSVGRGAWGAPEQPASLGPPLEQPLWGRL